MYPFFDGVSMYMGKSSLPREFCDVYDGNQDIMFSNSIFSFAEQEVIRDSNENITPPVVATKQKRKTFGCLSALFCCFKKKKKVSESEQAPFDQMTVSNINKNENDTMQLDIKERRILKCTLKEFYHALDEIKNNNQGKAFSIIMSYVGHAVQIGFDGEKWLGVNHDKTKLSDDLLDVINCVFQNENEYSIQDGNCKKIIFSAKFVTGKSALSPKNNELFLGDKLKSITFTPANLEGMSKADLDKIFDLSMRNDHPDIIRAFIEKIINSGDKKSKIIKNIRKIKSKMGFITAFRDNRISVLNEILSTVLTSNVLNEKEKVDIIHGFDKSRPYIYLAVHFNLKLTMRNFILNILNSEISESNKVRILSGLKGSDISFGVGDKKLFEIILSLNNDEMLKEYADKIINSDLSIDSKRNIFSSSISSLNEIFKHLMSSGNSIGSKYMKNKENNASILITYLNIVEELNDIELEDALRLISNKGDNLKKALQLKDHCKVITFTQEVFNLASKINLTDNDIIDLTSFDFIDVLNENNFSSIHEYLKFIVNNESISDELKFEILKGRRKKALTVKLNKKITLSEDKIDLILESINSSNIRFEYKAKCNAYILTLLGKDKKQVEDTPKRIIYSTKF